MAKVEVKTHNGYPAITIDDKVYPPMTVCIRNNASAGYEFDEEYYKALGEAGIKIFFIPCFLDWCKPGAQEIVKEILQKLFAAVPDAYAILRVTLFPSEEWVKDNPDECYKLSTGEIPPATVYTDGYRMNMPHLYSFASAKWQKEAGARLMDFCSDIDRQAYSDRVIGYQVCAGNTSEWYYALRYDTMEKYSDFGQAFSRYFGNDLRQKYKTLEELRKSWRDASAAFDNPRIPDAEQRYYAKNMDRDITAAAGNIDKTGHLPYEKGYNIGNFLDVDKCQGTLDYFDAYDHATADSIIYFCKLIKDKYNGNMLTGAFFGYYAWIDFFDSGTTNGVLKILDSECVDFLAAPGVYRNRQPGGFTGQRQMADSYRLRNKLFFVEEDSRTHLDKPFFKRLFDYYDFTDTENILKRDFGRNICEDLQAWWFDHLVGRYRDKDIYRIFARQQQIAVEAYSKNRTKSNEIALIYDEESVKAVSDSSTKALVAYFRDYEIARVGAGIDQYYHNDMQNPDMPDYKLYVFFNTFVLSDVERAGIIAKLKKNNATAVWMYASGVINPDCDKRISEQNIADLTGIKIGMLEGIHNPKYRITDKELAARAGLDGRIILGYESSPFYGNIASGGGQPIHYNFPLFYAEDKGADILAKFCESGLTAVAYKQCDGYKSVFHGSKIISSDLIRELARGAGCHIYMDSGDCLYVNNNYLTVHAKERGEKFITFNRTVSPYEVYQQKYYAKDVKTMEIDMQTGQTLMFLLN